MADKTPDPETISAELAAKEEKLSKIDKQREALRQQIEKLRADLVQADGHVPDVKRPQSLQPSFPSTTKEKVALFRSLFRGRTDVFPKRWENMKKGTAGYSPACANEWVSHLCDKPRVKCRDCPNQSFVPVSDQIILEHLQGRYVIGVYPLLQSSSCLFLAVDFDKGAWQEDVKAFVATCRQRSVPVAVERSRSGNGAHAWIFFQEPVNAQQARTMGSFLITQTMASRYEMTMDSYDRLFPNQDTMPKGGFGNLIALPFQNGPRQAGNSVFVDGEWQPYDNQWQYLASVRRLSAGEAAGLAREATKTGQVIGVFFDDNASDAGSTTPWMKKPANVRELPVIPDELPAKIRMTSAQLLFVEKAGLPSALLNQIKRLAAFPNPEYHRKQALRLSTALVPRVISCSEDHPEHIGLPRGCQDDLEALLAGYKIDLEIDDIRNSGKPINVCFYGDLTEIQKPAVRSILAHDTGVFVAPPGTGKTVVGINLIAKRARSTLVLVHRIPLLEQWVNQLAAFLKLHPKEIGRIGGGKRKPNGNLDVVMIQSLVRGTNTDDMVGKYGHVIIDECHHVPAISFERVMREVTAKYITGLTATPQRRDGHHPLLRLQLGPIRYTITQKALAADRSFRFRLILKETEFKLPTETNEISIQEIYRKLTVDKVRNDLIINDVITAVDEGRSPLLLTERREHLDLLADRLKGFVRNLVVMRGGMGAKQRRAIATQLKEIPTNEERLILATGRFIGEGFDDARLDTLFLAMPVSWKGTLEQYAGRLHRSHAGKTEVRIIDYVDRGIPMLRRMFAKRERGYRSMGYHESDLF